MWSSQGIGMLDCRTLGSREGGTACACRTSPETSIHGHIYLGVRWNKEKMQKCKYLQSRYVSEVHTASAAMHA